MPTRFRFINDLSDGMIVRHRGNGNTYTIQGVYGDHAIGVRTVDISQPNEWEIVYNPHSKLLKEAAHA